MRGLRSGCHNDTPDARSGDVRRTNSQSRSNKRLASRGKSATEDCGLAFFRGRFVLSFQFREVCQQLLFTGHAKEVKADHLIGPLRRLAAGPQTDQQARDDRAIRLDLNPVLVGSNRGQEHILGNLAIAGSSFFWFNC